MLLKKQKLLLTGGAGFIGHHTVEHLLKHTDWEIVILDRLSYSGNLNFLVDMDIWEEQKHRVKFVYHDFQAPISEMTKNLIGHIDYIIHMGAESHVDRSIADPYPFVYSNVVGTVNMLEYAKNLAGLKLFIYVSTDEVYGPSIDGHLHKEGDSHKPSNPYSASKSGAESFCYAYWNTYNLPLIITNTMNNFGERQNSEKFLPKVIRAAIDSTPLKLHCKKDKKGNIIDISSRCWLHAKNHADGLLFLIEHGKMGEKYNITGELASVKDIADKVGKIVGKPINYEFEDFHSFRPGHDMHYGLDGTKMRNLGWIPPYTLDKSLETTTKWCISHPLWL